MLYLKLCKYSLKYINVAWNIFLLCACVRVRAHTHTIKINLRKSNKNQT